MPDQTDSVKRQQFFAQVFQSETGYLYIGRKKPGQKGMEEGFFQYPDHLARVSGFVLGA